MIMAPNRCRDAIFVIVDGLQRDVVVGVDLVELMTLKSAVLESGRRAASIVCSFAAAAFTQNTRYIPFRERFERGDGGGENSNVGFDYGPVHGFGYCPGGVGIYQHGWHEGDANDGRNTRTVWKNDVSKVMFMFAALYFRCCNKELPVLTKTLN